MRSRIRVFGLLCSLLVGSTFLAGQPTAASPEPTRAPSTQATTDTSLPIPSLKVQTRLVVIDVIARDKKGELVQGLRAEDFKVLEDGKAQEVKIFSFQKPGAGEAAPASASSLPDNVFRNTPKFQPNGALNVVLMDALNTTFVNQAYVREEMVKFLEKLPEGQPIAIYALGRKLRLLQDFTTDRTELRRVIRAFKGESSHVLSNPNGTSEVPMTLQGWAAQTAADWAPQFKAQVEGFADQTTSNQTEDRVTYTLAALNSLARMLAGYPGRKNLIWISELIPFTVFPETKGIGSPTLRNYSDQLALLSNRLADAQIAVYPVDARGLVGSAFFNVSNAASGQSAMGGMASRTEGRQAEELFQAHSNMRDFADKTGGRAFYNRNDVDAGVRQDMEDGATYYTLGYYPSNKDWNGRFRKVHVSTGRSDVRLRYRYGYFAIDRMAYFKSHPEQQEVDFVQALNPDTPVATALQFESEVKVLAAQGPQKVQLNYAIDSHQISFEKTAAGLQHAEVDCAARAFSPRNIDNPVATTATRVNAELKPEVYDKISRSYMPCQLQMELPPGHYLLRLAVRDNLTGLLGSLNAEVTVPPVSGK